MAKRKLENDQPVLPFDGGIENISLVFRKLYFHLYTNSQTSRADRLVSDLSLLLLTKLAVEVNGGAKTVDRFLNEHATADETLVPLLRKNFPKIVDDRDKFGMGDSALRDSFRILSPVLLSQAPAHVLGEAFQALIGPRLRGEKGQFFTPRSLVRAMVAVVDPQAGESVLDPACGTGGFLAEAHRHQQEQIPDGQVTGRLAGIDKDHDLFRISSALLEITCGKRTELFNLNSLDPSENKANAVADGTFDVVLTNPPFGSKIGVRDKEVLCRFELARQWIKRSDTDTWHMGDAISASQDPQILFIELCVRKLKAGGRMGIVLPEGIFGNKQTGYIWEWLRSQGRISSLLDCPRTTFQPGTDTKTNVLFFEKGKQTGATDQVRIAVALNCGHDRRGRSHSQDGRPQPDDFASLSKDVRKWKKVRLKQPDYLVPRYYLDRQLSRDEESLTEGALFVALGDLRHKKVLSIRKGHEVGSDAYGTGDIPFVRTSDVNNFEISVDPTKAVSEAIYKEYSPQQKLQTGDILMVVDGRYRIGATALLSSSNARCVVQSHFRIISITDEKAFDPYELLFALNLPSVKLQLRNLVFVQSTLGTLGNRLLELEIPVLHGDGPWRNRVDTFRDLLQRRDESLAILRKMTGPECEL